MLKNTVGRAHGRSALGIFFNGWLGLVKKMPIALSQFLHPLLENSEATLFSHICELCDGAA